MDTYTFLMLLTLFSAITGLVVECIKKIVGSKKDIPYNLVTLIVALIIGVVGCATYYQLSFIPFTVNNIIYMLLMGFASGMVSQLGYDKIVQTLQQCRVSKK